MIRHRIVVSSLLLASFIGCGGSPQPEFALPKGDPELGKAAFLGMRCYDCHQIQGVELPPGEELNQVIVELGGEVTKVKSYSDLVTSIINPSHKLAPGYTKELVSRGEQSNMTNYNEAMTVSELINLVAYLQEQYKLKPPPDIDYYNYP